MRNQYWLWSYSYKFYCVVFNNKILLVKVFLTCVCLIINYICEYLLLFQILIQSVCETMVPKLVAEDIPLLFSLLNDVFPQVRYTRAEMTGNNKIIYFSFYSYIFTLRCHLTSCIHWWIYLEKILNN